MIKKIFLTFAIWIMALSANRLAAQTFNWVKQIKLQNPDALAVPSQIGVDDSGNVYSIGILVDTADFDPGIGVALLSATANSSAIFIQKLDSAGNFVWAKKIGGGMQSNISPEMFSFNNAKTKILIAGAFSSTIDFDPSAGVNNAAALANQDGFILSLTTNGVFDWVKTFKTNNSVQNFTMCVSKTDQILIGCSFEGTLDADPGSGIVNYSANTSVNALIVKLNSQGNYVWSGMMPSTSFVRLSNITVDNTNSIVAGGYFNGSLDVNPGTATNNINTNGGDDIFITKLDSAGNFLFGKKIGGSGDDQLNFIKIDGANQIIHSGIFDGNTDFDPGSAISNLSTNATSIDVYISKLTNTGNFVWAKSFTGNIESILLGIDVDAADNIYPVGAFGGTVDFDPNAGMQNLSASGDLNCFIAKYKSNGTYVYAYNLGSTDVDGTTAIKISSNNTIHTNGVFSGTTDFNPSAAVNNLTAGINATSDGFILKWNQCAITNTIINAIGCNYSYNGQTYTNNGTYIQNYTSAGGCDSIITINLFGSATNTTINTTVCGSNYSYNGITYTASGTYFQNYTNAAGCDSNTTLTLIFGTPSTSVQNITACDFYFDGVNFFSVSGSVTNAYTNVSGCDSTLILNVIINQSSQTSVVKNTCTPYLFNGTTYNTSGNYTIPFSGANGCDSIIDLYLTITPIPQTNIVRTGCKTYNFNGTNYTSSGIYSTNYISAQGCDSDVVVSLTIIKPIITIAQSGATLKSNAVTPATYQWCKCDPLAIIPAQTNQSFTATTNGNYAVITTLNGCSDTSACVAVTNVGLKNLQIIEAKIYPNPVQDELFIDIDRISTFDYSIVNTVGEIIASNKIVNQKDCKIDTKNWANGIYFISITIDQAKKTYRFVKQ
jgi:Secretion system C-terminal sorting domain